ncbi:MAG: GNAT family N-acetyltransferase [Solobacterium sp.]|nr:GNAT family N-acetyltransferase [Solobacterium sp.]
MEIRLLDEEEKLDALNLIREVFFSMGNLGMNRPAAQAFLEFLSAEGQNLQYYGMYDGDLVGTAAVNEEGDRIHLMFVRQSRQRQGIGTALWNYVKTEAADASRFMVNALKGSEGFYERLGFEAFGEETVSQGMQYLPMEYLSGKEYLGKPVDVTIEIPAGTVHPHLNAETECACGYADLSVTDGVFRNIYWCGSEETQEQMHGIVYGIIFHPEESGSRWIVVPEGFDDRQAVIDAIGPLEQFYDSRIIWWERT